MVFGLSAPFLSRTIVNTLSLRVEEDGEVVLRMILIVCDLSVSLAKSLFGNVYSSLSLESDF